MARNKSLWIVVVLGLMLVAAACSPPGANPEDQGAGSGGKEGQQQVQTGAESTSGKTCDVQPRDVTLEEATVGFSQTENNNTWRIAQGIDILLLAPRSFEGLAPALGAAN